ncbi:hypothetical protein SpCBS45565_g06571 [Spizellomyces sp. 'palustris']|nr:hypothetical protein SpCBS45565_g06571 [Spizellomyces sp. 'palustris']
MPFPPVPSPRESLPLAHTRSASVRTQYTPSVHSITTFALEPPFSSSSLAAATKPNFVSTLEQWANDTDSEERELKNTLAGVCQTEWTAIMHAMARFESPFRTRIRFMHLMTGNIPNHLLASDRPDKSDNGEGSPVPSPRDSSLYRSFLFREMEIDEDDEDANSG